MSATRGLSAVGLYAPKDAANIGGVLRAANCFGADMVVIAGSRVRRHGTDTTAAYRRIPLLQTDDLLSCRPWQSALVVVELVDGAQELHDFKHPDSAFYVFGPEDGNVPSSIISKAQHVVRLRAAACLNLAATVNVVLHDRVSKKGLPQ